MNRKAIELKIEAKVDDWLKTLRSTALGPALDVLKDNLIVTGGCIVSMLLNEKVNDYDIYFKSFKSLKPVALYYIKVFKECPPEKFTETLEKSVKVRHHLKEGDPINIQIETVDNKLAPIRQEFADWLKDAVHDRTPREEMDPYRPLFLSSNAITLSDQIQLVIRFHGSPAEIHENYDYAHCTSYWTKETGLVLNPSATESILTKELKYTGSLYPVCSIFRARKFINRGWKINAGELLKMILQIQELDLTDVKTLEDQLIGVDTTQFCALISKIREGQGDTTDLATVTELIKEFF